MIDLSQLEKQFGLPSGLLAAVQKTESGGNPNAVSPKGALGAFQFMPLTAQEYGIDPMNPDQAATGAARMYSDLLTKYNGDLPSALAGYNWGQGNVDRKGLENAPSETKNYISDIMGSIGNAIVPSANAAEMPDLSSMSDEELQKIAGTESLDLSQIPDEELQKIAGGNDKNTKTSALQNIFEQFGQGFSSGYLDDLTDPAAAGIVSLITGEPYSKVSPLTRKLTQERLSQGREEHPVSSVLADIGGIVSSFGLAGAGLASKAPKAAEALRAFSASRPWTSAALFGTGAGALRGGGEGTDTDSRLFGALVGGGLGAAAGPLGLLAARGVAVAAGKTGSALKSLFQKEAPVAAAEGAEAGSVEAGAYLSPLPKSKGDLFPKTAGQKTQNIDLQRIEADARAGRLTPQAQSASFAQESLQNKSYLDFMRKLGGDSVEGRNVNGIIDDVSSLIKSKASEKHSIVNNAYEVARRETGGVRSGVKIARDDIQKGLWKNIGAIRREGQFDVQQMPKAKAVLQRLARYSLRGKEGKISPTYLGELENWRKMATNAANSSQDKTEKMFVRKMVNQYDSFMENTAANAVDAVDQSAINAFRSAVKSRAEYGRLFEKNDFVRSIVDGERNLDDTVRHFVGSGGIRSQKAMAENLDAVLSAVGQREAPAVKSDLQNAFIKRIYEGAQSGRMLEGQPDVPSVSPAKLKKQLERLFVDQQEFATKLYGKDSVAEARKAIKELNTIKSVQPGVISTSGSSEWMTRFIQPILNRIPVVGTASALLREGKNVIAREESSKAAIKSLQGIGTFIPKSKIWMEGPIAGGELAGEQTRPDVPHITITPKRSK